MAPTTILGMSTRYSLGDRGAINLIGMYQQEQSAFTRPALGFEATANLIGGVNTELHFRPQGITRFLNSLTSRSATAPSLFDVNAEFAFTKPDPNRSGEAYLEEFEAEAGLQVSLREARGSSAAGRSRPPGWRTSGSPRSIRRTPFRSSGRTWSRSVAPISAARAAPPGHRHAHPARGPGRAARDR